MRIRSGLHADTGRNINVLSYELQEKAVDRLEGTAGRTCAGASKR